MNFDLYKELRTLINCQNSRILVNAGSGTGKSVACGLLALREAQRLNGVPENAQVLMISLTKNAVHNTEQKLRDLLDIDVVTQEIGPVVNKDDLLRRIRCSTMHSFCFSMLREWGWGSRWNVSESAHDENIFEEALGNLNKDWQEDDAITYAILDVYSEVLASGSSVSAVINSRCKYLASWSDEIREVVEEMDRIKKSDHIITYEDMISHVHRELQNSVLSGLLHRRYPVVIVDEYQDTGDRQWAIVKRLAGEGVRLLCAGDDGQTIFVWAGGSFGRFEDFKRTFSKGFTLHLTVNRRCTQRIANLSDELLAQSGFASPRRTTARGGGEKIQLMLDADKGVLTGEMIKRIRELADSGVFLDRMAILYRFNRDAVEVKSALSEAQIPYKVFGGKRGRVRSLLKPLSALVRVIENACFVQEDWKTLLLCVERVGERRVPEIIDWLKGSPSSTLYPRKYKFVQPLSEFLEFVNEAKSVNEENTDRLHRCTEYLKTVPKVNSRMGDHLRPTLMKLAEESRSLTEVFEKYEDPSYPLYYPGCQDPPYPESYITLSTVHRIKGSEFDGVLFMGTDDQLFDRYKIFEYSERIESELQLMNVAVTRARERLYLFFPIDPETWSEAERIRNPWFFIKQTWKSPTVKESFRVFGRLPGKTKG